MVGDDGEDGLAVTLGLGRADAGDDGVRKVAGYVAASDDNQYLAIPRACAGAIGFTGGFGDARFEMRFQRFRFVRNVLPSFVDIDFDTDVLQHLRADRDAMRVTFGTREDEIDQPVDDGAHLADLLGLIEHEANETAGDAE